MQEELQQEEPLNLERYWLMVCRRRRWIVLSTIMVWALALTASLLLPAKYKSETVILIEQPKVPTQYVMPNVTSDLQQALQSLTQQILSRTRLVAIMDKFNLYNKKPNEIASDSLVQHMRSDITIDLIKSGKADELSSFKISYIASSPVLAQQVTGQLTSLFIDENLRNQQELAEDTTAFLDSQLKEAGNDLAHQEKVLGEFRSKYLGELPEQLQGNVQILSGLQSRLQSATEGLNQAQQQRLYLSSLLGQSKNLTNKASETAATGVTAPSTLDQQLDRMRTDLATLNSHYTPQYPDIVRLKEQIVATEKLKRQLDDDVKTGKRSPETEMLRGAGNQAISPVAQLEGQLKANELEIANRKQEIKNLEAEIEQYQARLNLTPVREQQLAAVARNHEQSQTNYESLLAKKLQSEMATNLEKRQQGEQFRIIDPPSLPQKPYWPNRLLFSLGGLALGAALGFASSVAKEMTEARIYSEDELQEVSSVPVLVTIPALPTNNEQLHQLRIRKLEMAFALVMIVIIPALTLLVNFKG